MAMEFTQILLNAQSADGVVRKLAEENLTEFQEHNLATFLLLLSKELANNAKPAENRTLAGLILKNSLYSEEAPRKAKLVQKWRSLQQAVRSQIKTSLLHTLSSLRPDASAWQGGRPVWHTSAQVAAKIAAIELPLNEWEEFSDMVANMGGPNAGQPAKLKEGIIETLGLVCEDLKAGVLAQEQVNSILTAVLGGMNVTETTNDVTLAATKALSNVVQLALTNFANDVERDNIMKVVCEATLSGDGRVRQAAFECLVSISSAYYDKLSMYMQNIFAITSKAVKEDEELVALQAIEFWTSIACREIRLQLLQRSDSEVRYFRFIKGVLPDLVPMLLETLTKQDEDQDEEDRAGACNLGLAGQFCLSMVTKVVGRDMIPLVMPFVQENISQPDWACREAATLAFDSICISLKIETMRRLFLLCAEAEDDVDYTSFWEESEVFQYLRRTSANRPPEVREVCFRTSLNPVITKIQFQEALYVLLHNVADFSRFE